MGVSVVLEIATGLALMYLLLSLLVTAVNELIAQFSGIRTRHLESALRQMLKLKASPDDSDNLRLFDSLLQSPTFQIAGSVAKTWMSGGAAKPSYLSRDTFVAALREAIPAVKGIAVPADAAASDLKQLIAALPAGSPAKASMLSAIDNATAKAQSAEQAVGDWFDGMMERASGAYKRWMSTASLVIGLVLAVGLNCDSVRVATELANSAELRAHVTRVADQVVRQCTGQDGQPLKTADCITVKDNLATLQTLPVGGSIELATHPWAILGWLLTGIAVSLGAPFWFDLLSKVANIRSSLKPAEART